MKILWTNLDVKICQILICLEKKLSGTNLNFILYIFIKNKESILYNKKMPGGLFFHPNIFFSSKNTYEKRDQVNLGVTPAELLCLITHSKH